MNLRCLLVGWSVFAWSVICAGPAVAGPITLPTPSGSCNTTDPFSPDASSLIRFRPVPVGCELTSRAAFSFTDVVDASGATHDVVIDELVFFQLPATLDGSTFVRGSVDGVSFTGLDMSSGGSDLFTFITDPADQDFGDLILIEFPDLVIDWGDPLMFMTLAPGTSGIFAQTVDDLGGGNYLMRTGAVALLAVTLNGGLSFTAEDPQFDLAPFVADNHDGLSELLDPQVVPEPSTLTLIGLGLLSLARHRRSSRLSVRRGQRLRMGDYVG